MDKNTPITNVLTAPQREELLGVLKTRFEKHASRHPAITWADVLARLDANPARLWSLSEMERSGGEPDVVGYDKTSDEFCFVDCSPETPDGRRNVCYDRQALDARKTFKPATSALDLCAEWGVELLTEEQYRFLQTLGHFDAKTSSWVQTPPAMRALGGALFADYRFGRVFFYHNGADSYYGARGFRAALRV